MPIGERRRYSEESREHTVAAALQTLEQGVDAILTGEEFAAYLRLAARFHSYSFGNVLLISMQRPDATRVAGYRKWQELGRHVTKAEKGITILVPHKRTIVDEETEDVSRIVTSFGVATVFDISQTEGDPLPEPPRVHELRESSDAGALLFGYLEDYLQHEQVPLLRTNTKPANGYFDPFRRLIALDVDLSGDQATKTLTHETAHYIAGHTLGMDSRDVETVAESAAFVVLNHYGVDSAGYTFPYVARWAQDREALKRNLAAIQVTAHALIDSLEGLPSREVAGEPVAHEEGGSLDQGELFPGVFTRL